MKGTIKLEYCVLCQKVFMTNCGSKHHHPDVEGKTLVDMMDEKHPYITRSFMQSIANLVKIGMKEGKG